MEFVCFAAFCISTFTSMVFWVGYRLRGIARIFSRFFSSFFLSIDIGQTLEGLSYAAFNTAITYDPSTLAC